MERRKQTCKQRLREEETWRENKNSSCKPPLNIKLIKQRNTVPVRYIFVYYNSYISLYLPACHVQCASSVKLGSYLMQEVNDSPAVCIMSESSEKCRILFHEAKVNIFR